MNNIWRDRKLGLPINIRLYTSVVKAIFLYSAETWPLTKTETQRLEAAHQKWLRRILNVSWKDMIRSESIREQTGQEKLELSDQERPLRWLGHEQRMSDDRIAKQVLHWVPEDRRKRGRPCVTWKHVVMKDFEKGGLSWEEAMSLTADRREWRNWIAQCARHAED